MRNFNLLLLLLLCVCGLLTAQPQPRNVLSTEMASTSILPESAQWLSEYVQHRSITGHERNAGVFFSTLCKELGLSVRVLNNEEDSYNFAASMYPLESNKPNIIFMNHIDVVEAPDSANWQMAPFSGAIKDGYVWGRGAYDNKGMAVMQLAALRDFKRLHGDEDLPFNVTLLSVSGEETLGAKGAKLVTEECFDCLNPYMVVGEGPSVGVHQVFKNNLNQQLFPIAVVNKRVLWLDLDVEMHTHGHGSAHTDDCAMKIMNRAVNRLNRKFKDEMIFNETNKEMMAATGAVQKGISGVMMRYAAKNAERFPSIIKFVLKKIDPVTLSSFCNTANITGIQSEGKAYNSIPQKVLARMDCRLMPGVKDENFIGNLKKIINDDRVKISVAYEVAGSKASPVTHEGYGALKSAILQNYPGAAVFPTLPGGGSDCSFFRAKGIPVFSVIPVLFTKKLLHTVHGTDERFPIDMLDKGTTTYLSFLKNMRDQQGSQTPPVKVVTKP
jgi:carboxypeptidase PM20D1